MQIRIITAADPRMTKVSQVNEDGIERPLQNITRIKMDIDASKETVVELTMELLGQDSSHISGEATMYAITKDGEPKAVEKVVFVDGTEDTYYRKDL